MRLALGDRLPALQDYVLALGRLPVPERPGPHPRVDRPPGADGRYRLGVGTGEAQALFSQSVEVWGLDPAVAVGSDVVLPQAVYDDQDDVGVAFCGGLAAPEVRQACGQVAARAEQGRPGAPRLRAPGTPCVKYLRDVRCFTKREITTRGTPTSPPHTSR